MSKTKFLSNVINYLSRMKREYLLRLAKVMGISELSFKNKKTLAEHLATAKSEEIAEFLRFKDMLKNNVTLSHLRKIYQELLKFPPNEIRDLNTITEALIYLYEKVNLQNINSQIEEILKYANKLKQEKPVYKIMVETTSPINLDELASRLKKFEEEWNKSNVYRILIETSKKEEELNILIYEEYTIRVIEEFEETPEKLKVKSEIREPLRHKFIKIKKISDTKFEITANYPIDEQKKLGQNLIDTLFPEKKSISKPDIDLASYAIKAVSKKIMEVDNTIKLIESFNENKSHTKKLIEKTIKEKNKAEKVSNILNSIKLTGIYVVKQDIVQFSLEAKDLNEILKGVETKSLQRVLQQFISVAGEDALQLKFVINGKTVKIVHNSVQARDLSDEEMIAMKLFLDSLKTWC